MCGCCYEQTAVNYGCEILRGCTAVVVAIIQSITNKYINNYTKTPVVLIRTFMVNESACR